MQQCLLVLVVTPAIRDAVVDWLLGREDVRGFSSFPISGHGVSVHAMTIAEQVAGGQKQVVFQTVLPEATAKDVLAALQEEFSGSGMHYWLLPALSAGHIE